MRAVELPGAGGYAQGCSACHGIWVLGLEDGIDEITIRPDAFRTVPPHNRETDSRAGLCPYGHGILRRAQTHLEPPFYLERCSFCSGIWFDEGEWERVATQGLLESLFEIWIPAWQLRKQEVERQRRLIEEAREKLGPEIVSSISALGRTLHGHPWSSQAVALLIEVVRGGLDLGEEIGAPALAGSEDD